MSQSTPAGSYKAVVLTGPNPGGKPKLEIASVPTPVPVSGQALVRVLSFPVNAGLGHIFSGTLPFLRHWPLTPGGACIGRVEAVGPDALSLKPGQLVVIDSSIRGRDDPDQKIVLGLIQGLNPVSTKLATEAWRNGTLAEKVLVPLESVTAVDEELLVKERGYSYERILMANRFSLSYEGYKLAKLTPGDTVIVAWASGRNGNAAASLALALGAGRVIALSRDASKLEAWAKPFPPHLRSRLRLFSPTNDIAADTAALRALTPGGKGANIFFDLSPAQVGMSKEGPTHIKSCIGAMAFKGRLIFMGFIRGDVPLPYSELVGKDLSIVTGFMYEADTPRKVFRMLEAGLLDVSEERGYAFKTYEGLESFDEALAFAETSKDPRFSVQLKL